MWIRNKHPKGVKATLLRTISAQIHLLAALSTLPLGWLLIVQSAKSGLLDAFVITLYCIASTLVFSASGVYHFITDGFDVHNSIDLWLNRIDHWSIYIMIAGTYTAFFPKALPHSEVPILIAIVWTLAVLGGVYTFLKSRLHRLLAGRAVSTLIFVGFGWVGVSRAPHILAALTHYQLILLVLGGLAYLLGAVVYYFEKYRREPMPFDFHEIWHLAVVAGHFFHYFLLRSLYL